MYRPIDRRTAFTLVELLVVIGIIAVLVGILLPVLSRVRQQAQITKCSAMLRQIATASIMYANDNKGALPPMLRHRGDPRVGFAFANAGVLQAQNWDGNPYPAVGSNIGRLVALKYLGGPGGDQPQSPYYQCPNAIPDPSDNNRFRYFYNFHMKAVNPAGELFRMWPKLHRYGRSPKGTVTLYNLANGTQSTGQYPDIARAIVTDPVYGHEGSGNGKAYATHNLRKAMAFNLGYPDGSVRTAQVHPSTPLPASGKYEQIIGIIQYLEAVLGGNTTTTKYDFATYGPIPLIP